MNDDLISRGALKVAISEATFGFTEIPIRADVVIALIDNSPSMGATEERSQGEWIEITEYDGLIHSKCSQCQKFSEWGVETSYCPNCGAKMEVKKNENNM